MGARVTENRLALRACRCTTGHFNPREERRRSLVSKHARKGRILGPRRTGISSLGRYIFNDQPRNRGSVWRARKPAASIRNAPKVGPERRFWLNRSLRSFARPKAKIPSRLRLKGGLLLCRLLVLHKTTKLVNYCQFTELVQRTVRDAEASTLTT